MLEAEVAQLARGGGGAAAAAHARDGALASGSAAPAERGDAAGAYAALLARFDAVMAQHRASEEAGAQLRAGLQASEQRVEALSSEVFGLRAGKEAAETAHSDIAQVRRAALATKPFAPPRPSLPRPIQ